MPSSDSPNAVLTRIIATIGPASAEEAVLREMIGAGIDVCRINFSHGDEASHKHSVELIRTVAASLDRRITIIGDLCGPKIRLGRFDAPVELASEARIRVARGDGPCNATTLTVSLDTFIDEVAVGQRILIDDGLVRLLVVEKTPDALVCSCTAGGTLSTRKGVNLPDTRLDLPALTEKDERDLCWAIDSDLDYVALSFVRRPDDIRRLRDIISGRGAPIRVLSKIEKAEALEHLDAIIDLSDGVLIARGDLGVEMDVWRVPLIQKALTARCRIAAKPVIVATQMLQSMISSPMPTRAEVSDVANAILDGADAVMLSGETAMGRFPVQSIQIMNQIASVTEAFLGGQTRAACDRNSANGALLGPMLPTVDPGDARLDIPNAVAEAAADAALRLNARLVAVRTVSGNAARLLAARRLPMPVIGLTADARVARQMNLSYGLIPLYMDPITEPEELFSKLDPLLVTRRLAQERDLIVVVSATQAARPMGTNALMIHHVRAA